MKPAKILAGIDFSDQTANVLAYASLFARTYESSLSLLYVIDYLVTPPAYLVPYIEEEKRNAEKKFDAVRQGIADAGIHVDFEVAVGRLHEAFESAISTTNADMLVLGFASHALRRSSSEKLIKGLQFPMLVVRGSKASVPDGLVPQIRKILCPLDFSAMSVKALHAARELRDIFSAEMILFNVIHERAAGRPGDAGARDVLASHMRDDAKNSMDSILQGERVDAKGVIEEGEPHRRITSFAEENDFDLIVMGARGLGLIDGMLIGSVTNAVLKSSPCPVLVIH